MARTETVEFTNMCMICDGSRVVVIDREKRDWPGITFPGGHIEPGESFTDAVIREVQEETGLHIYVDAPDKSSGKRRQKVHIEYDLVGYIPVDELLKAEQA